MTMLCQYRKVTSFWFEPNPHQLLPSLPAQCNVPVRVNANTVRLPAQYNVSVRVNANTVRTLFIKNQF